ncbi:hypothetical protein [Vibrio crassostreae]|uniref:hypothetical protein n=1 Tax=Vibrio crassostreae TaxID=246167 RepID=UPI004068F994
MKLLNTINLIGIVGLQFLSTVNASGLTIDKMFVIADKNKNGIVTVANTNDKPLFVNANIDEFHVNDKGSDFIKTPYNSGNFEHWKISTTLNKLVLQPGESRNVGIRSLCYNTTCDDSKDLMFFVTFMPAPYKGPNESVENSSSMQLNYGFAPVFIIPTDKPKIDYTIRSNSENITVENKSNTMIYVSIDDCESKTNTKQCYSRFVVVAGRTKTFSLNERVRDKSLNINVSSYNGSYKTEKVLHPLGFIKDKT